MVSEAVALRLKKADRFLRGVKGRIGETVSGNAHVTVCVARIQIEYWIEG